MILKRTGPATVNIQRGGFEFRMMNGDIAIKFTVGFSVVRDLDGREVMPGQIPIQFERCRGRIEDVAERVFFSRQPHSDKAVALTRADFFG
jgi:hypothetical protein